MDIIHGKHNDAKITEVISEVDDSKKDEVCIFNKVFFNCDKEKYSFKYEEFFSPKDTDLKIVMNVSLVESIL